MPTIISSNLKRFQRQKELSIPKLAEQSGVSVRTIERIRTGKHVPDTQTILKLEKALGQDEGALVRGAVKKSDKHLEEFSKREIKEIIKRAKDPRQGYITYDEAYTKARDNALNHKPCKICAERTKKIQGRKDFTKFERELKPKELTGWAKDLVETMRREQEEWNVKVEKAKRQIFLALGLSAVLLSIALYLAL